MAFLRTVPLTQDEAEIEEEIEDETRLRSPETR
jgi:hypothetical protein